MTHIVSTYTPSSLKRSALARGAASAFDLRGNTLAQYRVYRSPEQADLDAIRNDWATLRDDFHDAAVSVVGDQH